MCLCFLTCLVLIFLATLNTGYKVLMKEKERLEIPFQRILCMVRERETEMYLQVQAELCWSSSLPFRQFSGEVLNGV